MLLIERSTNNNSRIEDSFPKKLLSKEWEKNLVNKCSEVMFSNDEINILNLELKISYAPIKIPIENIFVGIELVFNYDKLEN